MKGVLLMAYGSPGSIEGVEKYYTHIRGGRKPSPEQLLDLVGRYNAIGGPSPLLKITERQATLLGQALAADGSRTKVYAGMKHSDPLIADVIERARGEGVDSLLCIALAPHYSSISTGGYMRAVDEGARSSGIKTTFVKSWQDDPKLVSMWAGLVARAGSSLSNDSALVFSAHSLPARIISEGDPYMDQLLETSRLVAEKAGRAEWSFAFQSASKTGEPWLGPDILEQLEKLQGLGKKSFLLAPLGFVADHLEILYDIDVECNGWARSKGVELRRCALPNDSPELVDCLKGIVSRHGFE